MSCDELSRDNHIPGVGRQSNRTRVVWSCEVDKSTVVVRFQALSWSGCDLPLVHNKVFRVIHGCPRVRNYRAWRTRMVSLPDWERKGISLGSMEKIQ